MQYCESIFETKRRKTREVKVGSVGIGGNNPIRIQSMTTSNTRDVEATVSQVMRLEQAGCEMVRVTVQGIKEAESCEAIRSQLIQKGCFIPLIADIHFYPPAALKATEFVDKVRINPGNFADKRALFIQKTYDDHSYLAELEKIEATFSPLVEKCKVYKRAMRIGVNHGSLSDRIMNRYGDTPHGMVESALEFARICRKLEYHDFLFSMKASNPLVMIRAYRLLSAKLLELGWDYPLHLGVTEAGEGEDGRIKSSIGIGSLLLDGIGDTIRVSLTEDPWQEIDPCERICKFVEKIKREKTEPFVETFRDYTAISPSNSIITPDCRLHQDGSVVLEVDRKEFLNPSFIQELKLKQKEVDAPDWIWVEDLQEGDLNEDSIAVLSKDKVSYATQVVSLEEAIVENTPSQVVWISSLEGNRLEKALACRPKFFLFSSTKSLVHEGRRFFEALKGSRIQIPVILLFSKTESLEDTVIEFAMECGTLLIDGLFDGVCLKGKMSYEEKKALSFALMQAARKRTTKTEFISCPGCGRTLFNLQEVSKRIRDKTSHLPGVKIAIMGCIVNGPGEMADADFGYVGSRPGKIDLYVGKQCVEKDIDFSEADEKLISLIKQYGKWVEPALESVIV
jgi:(E)-4-hydroxy-3-methylbut-2-enyl-diphosphate synthase